MVIFLITVTINYHKKLQTLSVRQSIKLETIHQLVDLGISYRYGNVYLADLEEASLC